MPASEHEQVRSVYGALFHDISAALFWRDPIGINFESNTDGCDPEARTILPRLESCRSEAEALIVIQDEFQRWFGSDIAGSAMRYHQVAAEVWKIWQRSRTNKG